MDVNVNPGTPEPTTDSATRETWEERRFGPWTASSVVVANMIGAGLFTTSGFALADLGSRSLVLAAWALGGAIALCGALAYGGIARHIPVSGGEATYLGRTVHPRLGFMAGWVSILAGFTGPIAAAALAIGPYLDTALGSEVHGALAASLVIAAAAWVHSVRPRAGAASINLLVLAKAIGLTAFVVWAVSAAGSLPPPPSAPAMAAPPFDLAAFATTLVWISFSFSGWNGAVYLAGEIRNPERELSRVLWMPTLGVTVVYLAVNAVFLLGPTEQLAGRADIGAAAAEALGGPIAARWIALLVLMALVSSVSVMVLSGSRVLSQLARDGMLPIRISLGRGAPRLAIAFQALLSIGFVWATDLAQLIATLGFTLGLSAAATVGVAAWLRHREGPEAVPIPGYPIVPLIFMVFTLGSSGFLVMRSPQDAALGTAMLLAGWPAYEIAKRWGKPR